MFYKYKEISYKIRKIKICLLLFFFCVALSYCILKLLPPQNIPKGLNVISTTDSITGIFLKHITLYKYRNITGFWRIYIKKFNINT